MWSRCIIGCDIDLQRINSTIALSHDRTSSILSFTGVCAVLCVCVYGVRSASIFYERAADLSANDVLVVRLSSLKNVVFFSSHSYIRFVWKEPTEIVSHNHLREKFADAQEHKVVDDTLSSSASDNKIKIASDNVFGKTFATISSSFSLSVSNIICSFYFILNVLHFGRWLFGATSRYQKMVILNTIEKRCLENRRTKTKTESSTTQNEEEEEEKDGVSDSLQNGKKCWLLFIKSECIRACNISFYLLSTTKEQKMQKTETKKKQKIALAIDAIFFFIFFDYRKRFKWSVTTRNSMDKTRHEFSVHRIYIVTDERTKTKAKWHRRQTTYGIFFCGPQVRAAVKCVFA